MNETPLLGGRATPGVVRRADTVRRPQGPHSAFSHLLLEHLEAREFPAAPRFLGVDDLGREILSFIPGDVPPELRPDYDDETLAAAAKLIRRFHEVTAGSALAGDAEVVCHNDLSPCNFVFDDGRPVGLIDFDAAAPGPRVRDLGYALFLWLCLGSDGPGVPEQLRRMRLFLDAYGLDERHGLIGAIIDVQREVAARIGPAAARWWSAQADWVEAHRDDLEAGL